MACEPQKVDVEVKGLTDLPRTETMVACGPTCDGAWTSVCITEGKSLIYVLCGQCCEAL